MPTAAPLAEVYERLLSAFGPQHWWPADSRFEVMVGAVLTQNTSWINVEKSIAKFQAAGKLSPQAIYDLPIDELAQLVLPAGPHRVKAKRLHNLISLVVEGHGGSLDALLSQPQETLRAELLAVHGVGPETADCIVLYAAGQPSFVIDAYTRRVLERHGWATPREKYDELQRRFESALPADMPMFNEYHALLVEVGKRHCKPTPVCEGCPLECLLPYSRHHKGLEGHEAG